MNKTLKLLKLATMNHVFAGILIGILISTFPPLIFDPFSGINNSFIWGVLVGSFIAQVRNWKLGGLVGTTIGIPSSIFLYYYNTDDPFFNLAASIILGIGFGTIYGGTIGILFGGSVQGVRILNDLFEDMKCVKAHIIEIEMKVNEIYSKQGVNEPVVSQNNSTLAFDSSINSLIEDYNLTPEMLFEVINLVALEEEKEAMSLLRQSSEISKEAAKQIIIIIRERIGLQRDQIMES